MSMVKVKTNPSLKELRLFGAIWMVFFAVVGTVAWFKWGAPNAAVGIWTASVVVPVIGWIMPRFMRLVFVGMSYAAWPIGVVVSFVMLAVIYYLVVTPIGILTRLLGYDSMQRKRSGEDVSYWSERDRSAQDDPKTYFRQF